MTRSFQALATLMALTILGFGRPAMGGEYLLEPQDKLRIRVVEWRSAEGVSQEWAAVSGDYVVGPEGTISVPLLGPVDSKGKSVSDLAETISNQLKERMALARRPETSVQITEFRPIYILGDVARPGEFPYRPGLTVLQALGVAGGNYRGDVGMRVDRDTISASGSEEVSRLAYRRALAKQARLKAEIANVDDIDVPAELTTSDGPQLMADEAAIKMARKQAFESQIRSMDSLKDLLTNSIKTLDQKAVTQDKALDLSRKQLDTVSTLVDKGLSVSARSFELERSVADLETRRLDVEMASLKAKQDLSEADRKAIDLTTKRSADLVSELQQTQSNIDELSAKLSTAQNLIAESVSLSGRLGTSSTLGTQPVLQFKITRIVDGKSVTTPVTEDAAIVPGDVLRVERLDLPHADVATSSIQSSGVAAPTAPQTPAQEANSTARKKAPKGN